MIGCSCSVCKSHDPKNKRTRASIAVEYSKGRFILIDTSPELRLQLLGQDIHKVEAVLYTHMHADHIHGFDDLRALSFRSKQAVPVYLFPEYEEELRTKFSYAFENTGYLGAKPQVSINLIDDGTILDIAGLRIQPARLPHGSVDSCGFKIGKFAYATDFKSFPDEVVKAWHGDVDVMVASGIHFGEHHSHSVIQETLDLFRKLGVKRGVISHLSHEVDYLRDAARLPPDTQFAYDGMIIDL